jgi:polysaccharide deacetylase family protein (PEP-CTERM system associated)
MLNALTIDIEDYFQVTAFERRVKREDWDRYPLRVVENTSRLLGILDEYDVKATFFVLGWVAERCPFLVKEIDARGHEVACHGYDHRRVCTQARHEFRSDIRKSKALLENIIGSAVRGYRAPSYSISMDSLWAYDELTSAGFRYDSSVFPVRHDLYGIPDWPRHPFTVSKGADGKWRPVSADGAGGEQMREIPITTLPLGGKGIPIAGGGYFRFFPYLFTRWGLRWINNTERRPFVFYLHPWELDPGQPRINGAGAKSRFRHYLNLHRTEARFRRMLSEFRFSTIRETQSMEA